ncbi:serine/arginine repetitive matrix protein 2 isoform X2 [Nasonia vitripennis]|nr:serine/arginine repetitive matrix protein 2 isoform X2 [Nasonia vitripennis]
MNYYQEPTSYYHGNYGRDSEVRDFNHMSMLGSIPEPSRSEENDLGYDPDYDEEVNKLLEEVEEELLEEDSTVPKAENVTIVKADRDQYEDFYDEFAPEEPIGEIPLWYSKNLDRKQQLAIERLRSLSLLVSYASRKAWEHIKRIEHDHHTPFCKINPPRHPPVNKPWQNYWKFRCNTKCKVDPPEPNHAHTADCEEILLEHFPTNVSTKTKNIMRTEFPDHVMRTVELFQNFVNATAKTNPYLDSDVVPDTTYERPSWTEIRVRVNYKNEILLVAYGKAVTPLLEPLKKVFKYGVGRTCNVVSLSCINSLWSLRKYKPNGPAPKHLYGTIDLRDKVGPIIINYNAENKITFNSAESEQLGRVMMEYLNPTPETTVIDIGCGIGVLSLMLATKCDKVIGLSHESNDIKLADQLMKLNKIHNASFISCTTKDVFTKCSSLVKKNISVAVLNLATPFGKSPDVMKSLRNLPTVWRVALYGTFSKEFQKHITILTSSDHHMGDEFLPMQACVVEKSPTMPEDFHIVVVFERKSLIEPSVDLIGFGPTLNLKEDSDSKCVKPVVIPDVKTSEIVGKGYGKFRQYDSPALPKGSKGENVTAVIAPPPSNNDEPTSVLPPDYGKPVKIFPPLDIAKLYEPRPDPVVHRQLKKIYDSPLLPKSNDSTSAESKKSDGSTIDIAKLYESVPNPVTNRCLKKMYDSPLLPKSNDSSSAESKKSDSSFLTKSIKAESDVPSRTSNDPRCDFLSDMKPLSPAPTDPRRGFSSRSDSSLPLSTDPRCDFLEEAITFNPNREPFDQKKVPIRKKERNNPGSMRPKKENRFDYPSIKKEKQSFPNSSSSQDSNSRSPPPMKKEPRIEAPTQTAITRKAFNIPSTFKTETVDSTTFPVKKETRFDSPPLPGYFPPKHSARPPDYVAPPANFYVRPPGFNIPPPSFNVPPPGFSIPPPGFMAPAPGFMPPAPGFMPPTPGFMPPTPSFMPPAPDFSVPPPLPKQESLRSSVEKEEGKLSPDSTFNKLPKQNSDASSKPDDVFLDAIIKSEPMELDEDCNEEKLPREQPHSSVQNNELEKSKGDPKEVTPKQEPTQTFPVVRIKSEPIDPSELSDHTNEPPTSTELPDSTELPVRIKTEPIDEDEPVTTTELPPPTKIKQEMLSPTLDREAFMNMPTPVHRPASLVERDRNSVSPPPASANFKTMDGFEFSVQPNQSYLSGMASTTVKKEIEVEEGELEDQDETPISKPSQPDPVVTVKREVSPEKFEEKPPIIRVKKLGNISNSEDDEISIIAEKKSKKVKKEKEKSKSKYDSKYKKEKKKKYKGLDLDMRQLMDEKRKIKRILKRQRDSYDCSLSPSPDRKRGYRSPSTNWDRGGRSPPAAYRRANRSPSTKFERWIRQSPSPSGKYPSRASPSRDRWSRRSSVSPSSSRRRRRSSSSSSESQLRRSPSLSRERRFKRSPVSPSERRFKRSPVSPSERRFKRSPVSPSERRFKRSPVSPSSRRYKRSPVSPSERRFKRSSVSPSDRQLSTVSPPPNRSYRYSSPSPSVKRFKRTQMPPSERPLRRSPSPPSERRFSRSSISPSGDRNSRRSSLSPGARIFQRSPSQYKWTRTSPLSFGEINSMLRWETRSPSAPRFTQSAMGNYADLRKTSLSPVFDSIKRKSSLPPEALGSSATSKTKSGNEIGDQWDIPGKADLSPISTSSASSRKNSLPSDSVSSKPCTTTADPAVQDESAS